MKSFKFKIKSFLMKGFARHFKIILIFIVLFISLASYIWVLRPELEKVEEESNLTHIESYGVYLENYLNKLESAIEAKNKLEREYKDRLKNLLPTERDFPGIFVQLQALAEENGFVPESIEISQLEKDNSQAPTSKKDDNIASEVDLIEKLNISIVIAGNNYEALKKFLSEVEYNLRLLDVYSINFSSVESGPYHIMLDTYYLPE